MHEENAEVARDNAIAVEREEAREDDEDHKPKGHCSYHVDGEHRFIECDEWSPTCWCGKTKY